MSSFWPCPKCGSLQNIVKDSRPIQVGGVRRRRMCGACDHRWRTVELDEAIVSDVLEVAEAIGDVADLMQAVSEARARLRTSGPDGGTPITKRSLNLVPDPEEITRGRREKEADPAGVAVSQEGPG